MVATLSLDELQVTASVMSTVVPSSKVPMAVNCLVWPELIEALVGLIAIDRKLARVTVTLVEPLMVADVAVILTVPAATAVTRPAPEIVATVLSSEDQVADPVMFLVLPSSYVPVAIICLVLPTETDGVACVTVMLVNVGSTKIQVSGCCAAKTIPRKQWRALRRWAPAKELSNVFLCPLA